MEKIIDIAMTKLFQLAEYVCSKCSSSTDLFAGNNLPMETIRFSKEDVKMDVNEFI